MCTRRLLATTVLVVIAATLAACSSSSSRTTASAGTPTNASSAPTSLVAALTTPGSLITSKSVSTAGVNGTAYRVEYWSDSVPANKPVKVSGLVIVPKQSAPAGGWPVVSWAHQTNGMVGNCAPSLDPATDVPLVNNLLAKGWEVTASDYLNENAFATTSKALMPFNVATEAARNVIDIVRAARHMPGAKASANYLVLGWSLGAQTALFDSKIAASYAPKLHLEGAVANAPPSRSFVSSFVSSPANWYFGFMDLAGMNAAYGNTAAPLSQVLTPTGIKLITTALETEPSCVNGIFTALSGYKPSQVFSTTTFPPAWQKLLNENDPGTFTAAGPAPVLIVQGDADQIVSPSTSATLAGQLCTLSPPQKLQRWLYAGLDHFTGVGQQGTANANGNGDAVYTSSKTNADIVRWMSDRFAGRQWPDPYRPTGGGSVAVTQTNSC